MGKSQETFSKKEREKQKVKKRQEKELKKEERKASAKDGNNLEDMLAYVDENGQISSTPPDPRKRQQIIAENIELGVPKRDNDEHDAVRTGTVIYFNSSKGYGFIRDHETQESVFVHINGVTGNIKEKDKVTFEVGRGPKGPTAMSVKITS